jgi:nucleoside-diphosphate-sugar epimerase
MNKKVIIFGNGYVSKSLIHKLKDFGWTIFCTSRKVDLRKPIKDENVTIINFLDSSLSSIIETSNILLSTAPPNTEMIDPVLEKYADVISETQFDWIGYLSSTSVYGNHDGAWVDEETECRPSNDKSKIRLLAEKQWLDLYFKHNQPVHIFRLSGIYGPGRNCLEDIIAGKDHTIVKEDQYFSRTHVDDICQAMIASINCPTAGEIYNISDDEPSHAHTVQQFGANILGKEKLKEIPIEKAVLSETAKGFFQDSKKVKSEKIIQKLNIRWKYPNYRQGLLEGCLPYIKI